MTDENSLALGNIAGILFVVGMIAIVPHDEPLGGYGHRWATPRMR